MTNALHHLVQSLELLEQVAAVAEGHDETHADLSALAVSGQSVTINQCRNCNAGPYRKKSWCSQMPS